jgi:hypothetical protein
MNRRSIFVITTALLFWLGGDALGQTSGTEKEFWPKVATIIELFPKTRIEFDAAKQDGEDLARTQRKFGVLGSYRMKRLVKGHQDIDDEKNHVLALGIGYEHLFTDDNGSKKSENRVYIQGVPHYSIPGTGLLLQDRSRVEFRWVNKVYSTRYRNKATIERPLKIEKFRFTPYAAGELFYDGQHHKWNQNQYAFGVILPYKKLLSVDTYFVRQNCTTCKEEHINAIGLSINLYLSLRKK